MPDFKVVKGDIFSGPSCHLVNPVNTMGVAGKGLAREFKLRYPFSYVKYRDECKENRLTVGVVFKDSFWEPRVDQGSLFSSTSPTAGPVPLPPRMLTVYYLPTKTQWYQPSRIEFVQKGLKALAAIIQQERLPDISIPALGCGAGQLNWEEVQQLIQEELAGVGKCHIYLFEPKREVKRKR